MRLEAFAFVVACAAFAGCTLQEGAQAPHGQGVVTGNATYDDFFGAVREVREKAAAAPKDAESGHADLLKALGLDATATSSAAIIEAGARAKKLQDKGVLLHLEIAPEPKVVAARGKVDVGSEGEGLFKAMESTLRTSLETRKRLAALATRAADLEKKRAELRDKADTVFKDESPSKRESIVAELDAAKGALADASDGAARADGAESRFVVDLVYAVETGGGTRPENAKPPAKKPVWAGRARPAAAAPAGGAPAAPPPKKKSKGGDDFEP